MKKRIFFTRPAGLLASTLPALSVYAQVPGFTLIKKTVIGGEGGRDYLRVDSRYRRIYVSHATYGTVIPQAPEMRSRGNVFALTSRNHESGLNITPETAVPQWHG